jgi:hypothetical protein
MGAYICKQPNGKFCRFSTVVDTVTNWNMTEQDYIDMCVADAIRRAKEVLANPEPFGLVKYNFRPYNNTIEEFDGMLKEMGDNGLTDKQKKELEGYLLD